MAKSVAKHNLKNSTEYLSFAMASTTYYSVIKSRTKWAGHVARMGKRKGAHRVLTGRPEGKRPVRCRRQHINPYPANVENMVSS